MDNVKDIKENLQGIVKDHVRLYSLKGVEKSSLFLGVILTFFIVLVIFLMGIVFASIALAQWFNQLLEHAYMGYLIVGGIDIFLAVLLLLMVRVTKVPLMTNLIVRILVNIFNLGKDEDK